MLLYFAAPLFSDAERAFNRRLAERIEALGIGVFLPQRDGAEADRAPYDSMSREQRRVAMFRLDRDRIFACDVFLIVTDGRVPDEGAAVELGMANAHRELTGVRRQIVALHTDVRRSFAHAALNPMLAQAVDVTCTDVDELLEELARYRSARPPDSPADAT
jgi:nucleoside 2-deoxyribosyltransferase